MYCIFSFNSTGGVTCDIFTRFDNSSPGGDRARGYQDKEFPFMEGGSLRHEKTVSSQILDFVQTCTGGQKKSVQVIFLASHGSLAGFSLLNRFYFGG